MTGFREPIQGNVPYYLDLQVKERIEKLKVDADVLVECTGGINKNDNEI